MPELSLMDITPEEESFLQESKEFESANSDSLENREDFARLEWKKRHQQERIENKQKLEIKDEIDEDYVKEQLRNCLKINAAKSFDELKSLAREIDMPWTWFNKIQDAEAITENDIFGNTYDELSSSEGKGVPVLSNLDKTHRGLYTFTRKQIQQWMLESAKNSLKLTMKAKDFGLPKSYIEPWPISMAEIAHEFNLPPTEIYKIECAKRARDSEEYREREKVLTLEQERLLVEELKSKKVQQIRELIAMGRIFATNVTTKYGDQWLYTQEGEKLEELDIKALPSSTIYPSSLGVSEKVYQKLLIEALDKLNKA